MTRQEKPPRKDAERVFKDALKDTGLRVEDGKSIRSNKPVEDKNGVVRKTVTNPDFHVINPKTNKSRHVEVTNGSGKNSHKAAQKRVVDEAGVDNYSVLTGDQVSKLANASSVEDKERLLSDWFEWDDSN